MSYVIRWAFRASRLFSEIGAYFLVLMENIFKSSTYPGTVLPADLLPSSIEIALNSHAMPGKDGKRCVESTPANRR